MSELFLGCALTSGTPDRFVVIKKRHKEATDRESIELFRREIQLGMSLNHPNIVQIYEMGEVGSDAFIAMEWIHGKTLRQILEKLKCQGKAIPKPLVGEILFRVAKALEYAHAFTHPVTGQSLAVIHRDLSPHNIMVTFDGHVKLIDFGIARAVTPENQTVTAVVRGKPSYLAPEQISDGSFSARTDIFSFGAILYESLTGAKAFSGATDYLIFSKITNCDQVQLNFSSSEIPEEVRAVLQRCLRQKAPDRPASISELLKPLNNLRAKGQVESLERDLGLFLRELFFEELQGEEEWLSGLRQAIDRFSGKGGVSAGRPPVRPPVFPLREGEDTSLPEIEMPSPPPPPSPVMVRKTPPPQPPAFAPIAIPVAEPTVELERPQTRTPVPRRTSATSQTARAPSAREEIQASTGRRRWLSLLAVVFLGGLIYQFGAELQKTSLEKWNSSKQAILELLAPPWKPADSARLGYLSITGTPGAKVEISGRDFYKSVETPVELLGLPPGSYTVRIKRKPPLPEKMMLWTIRAGERGVIDAAAGSLPR